MSVRRAWSQAGSFVRLPRAVRRFYLRALLSALRHRDRWSLTIAVRPLELRALIELAAGGPVAEIGTGTGWSTAALAAAGASVVSLDPIEPPQRVRYLALAGEAARARIRLLHRRGDAGPPDDEQYRLLFIDAGHGREETIGLFQAWLAAVRPGGVVAFHDHSPAWPGVVQAVRDLGLEGRQVGVLFVWVKPPESRDRG